MSPYRTNLSTNDSPVHPPIPVGLATQAGLGTAGLAFVLAVIAFIQGDRSEETISALGVGLLSVLSVVWGRMSQAKEQIKASAPASASAGTVVVNSGSSEVADEDEPEDTVAPGVADIDPPAVVPPDEGDGASADAKGGLS